MEPLLVRAARREPVERTPVWFMRQAGRSLPEYRELRKQYGLFEIARQPELCAEVTLQPVRRHDVDAAVMFADIMLPVLGMGVDVELVENVGPGRRLAGAHARRRRAAGRALAGGVRAVDARVGAPRARGAARRPGGGRLRRRAVHGRGLPDRGQAVARVQADEGVHVLAAGGLARADGEARRRLRAVRRRLRAAPGPTRSSCSTRGPARSRSPTTASSSRPTRRACSTRSTCRRSTSRPGDAHLLEERAAVGGDVIGVDWRVPLDVAWERVGHDRGIQGNLDGAVLLGPWERVEAGTRDVLERAAGRPGHIFNLGHGVLPETDPDALGPARPARARDDAWWLHERRGRPDGVWEPGHGGGRAAVPGGHPPRAAGLGRGGRRAGRALPADRRALAARRGHRGAARRRSSASSGSRSSSG